VGATPVASIRPPVAQRSRTLVAARQPSPTPSIQGARVQAPDERLVMAQQLVDALEVF